MAISKIVKINHINNLSDARYCAGMGVEMLGFSIDEGSKHYVSHDKFKEIRSWITGIKIVIETTESDVSTLLEKIETYSPDFVQISNPYLLPTLKSKIDKPLILSIEANQDADTIDITMQKCKPFVDYFLLESSSLTNFSGDWPDFLRLLSPQFPILLGFGISLQNVASITSAGIALNGSNEIRPGYTDFGDLMDILEKLEEE